MTELGETLRAARLKKDYSLEEAAQATRIKSYYLQALEDGDYHVLPGPAYITGFLRNYARHLDLPPEDIVQEYYAQRPAPIPVVKAATRVLASGQERRGRIRVLWTFAGVLGMLAAGFAVKTYNDAYGSAYSAPLSVTASSLAVPVASHPHVALQPPRSFSVRVHAVAPVWVRITVDGKRAFQGILRARAGQKVWRAYNSVYVVTYDGAHLRVSYNGQSQGFVARRPGLVVDEATPRGWKQIS